MVTAEDIRPSDREYIGKIYLARRIEMQEQSRTLIHK